MDQQLVALYEIKRQAFLNGFIQNPQCFAPALAYAYFHRVAPIFHEAVAREHLGSDPFAEVYAVKREFVNDVTKYVDDRWLAKDLKAVEFYKLEQKFGGHHVNRIELIHTLEYARIDGKFDEALWKAVESNAPSEANSLDSTFTPKDVHFG